MIALIAPKEFLSMQGICTRIDRKAIIAGRERRAKTPFQARHLLDTMRGFFQWELENEHVKADPTDGLKIGKSKTDGFPAWTDAEIEQYERADQWGRAST